MGYAASRRSGDQFVHTNVTHCRKSN